MEKLKRVFENEHFVAVDKPPAWLTVPSRLGRKDERPCLGFQIEEELGQAVYPVHRLDFEVSGLVLFALNAKAHRQANAWFEHHRVEKTYSAWSEWGEEPPSGEVEWQSRIVRGKKRAFVADHGLEAITRAECLASEPTLQRRLWQLKPQTGRPHQLRVELSRRSWPIVGDTLYGASQPWQEAGIALRAIRLVFNRCEEAASLGLPLSLEVSRWESR